MNNKIIGLVVAFVALVFGGWYLYGDQIQLCCAPPPTGKEDLIRVSTPVANARVASPLLIEGQARGNWYFEASFPVKVLDAGGGELGGGIAQAQGEWMTTEFVPFTASLTFRAPSTDTGTLVLKKDNPSDKREFDDELRIPIRFDRSGIPERTIKLYYYNPNLDKDASGNVNCTEKGLVAVSRTTPLTQSPIQDAIKLLLKGELSANERAQGITTEFPLTGFSLAKAVLTSGNLALTFSDPKLKSSGGSCRVIVLRAQVEATAKQFEGVNNVTIYPESVFQP